jgi:hypothetical protein
MQVSGRLDAALPRGKERADQSAGLNSAARMIIFGVCYESNPDVIRLVAVPTEWYRFIICVDGHY